MKRRAIVTDVTDPKGWGRIQVSLVGFGDSVSDKQHNRSPWCWPCSALAGPGYGFYCLPEIDDEVWVESTADNSWVWTGFYWSARNPKPSDGSQSTRLFRTPAGHQIKLDEDGSVELLHSNGSTVELKTSGDINVIATGDVVVNGGNVKLNGDSGDVVTTSHICAFTGGPHVLGSQTVKAGG